MASSSSPIHHFFNSFAQHEKNSLQQALFLTAANILTFLTVAAAFSLYYVLQSFLRPLLWAVLLGTFLYPFKQSATKSSRRWINHLKATGTPLMISIAFLPIQTSDALAEMVAAAVMERYYFLISMGSVFLFGRLLYIYKTLQETLEAVFQLLYELCNNFSIILENQRVNSHFKVVLAHTCFLNELSLLRSSV